MYKAYANMATGKRPVNRILIVDRKRDRAQAVQCVFGFLDYESVVVEPDQWRSTANRGDAPSALVIGDCGSGKGLASLLQQIEAYNESMPVLILSEKEDSETVPDVQTKLSVRTIGYPLDHAELQHTLHANLRQSVTDRSEISRIPRHQGLIGASPAIQRVRRAIDQVAQTESTVMILGGTGTGKEVVAKSVHVTSPRRDKPFVAVNCGAIPGDLLESELFGHEKGAFTGAITARQGRFEMARGGTLFLDEIGDMPLAMQVKLLRVLQERTFERVGSNRSIKADVRIITATHRDMETAICDGKFREDLYYRLNVFPIELPPLRERREDIPLLIQEMTTRLERRQQITARLTQASVQALTGYDWPGNVRELANLIERLSILFPATLVDIRQLPEKYLPEQGKTGLQEVMDSLETESLPAVDQSEHLPREGLDLKQRLASLETQYITQALDESSGVVTQAAKLLRMRRTTLVEKLRKYGIDSRGARVSQI